MFSNTMSTFPTLATQLNVILRRPIRLALKNSFAHSLRQRANTWMTFTQTPSLPPFLQQFRYRNIISTSFLQSLGMLFVSVIPCQLKGLPQKCDGCYQKFDIPHAMKCNCGGLVICRHDAIRDFIGGLVRESGLKVSTELHVKDAPSEGEKAMRGNLEITGLTHPHSVDILDVVLVDPDSSFRQNQTIQQILHNTEYRKNRKYRDAARQHRNARFIHLHSRIPEFMGAMQQHF